MSDRKSEARIKRSQSKIKNQSGTVKASGSDRSAKVTLTNVSHFSVECTSTNPIYVSFRSTLDGTNKINNGGYREFKAGDNAVFNLEIYLHGNGSEAGYSVNIVTLEK